MAKSQTSSAPQNSQKNDQPSQPWGDIFAKVRGDKDGADGKERGDKLVKVGAVWETQNGNYELTMESEPVAWQRQQPGAAWPQLRSFIIIERRDR